MHREIKKLLGSAQGESKSVLALNLDVRDFSKFSLEVDSVETALYIRKLYERILDEFFPDASFFKPTGDGLLIVFELDEGNTKALTKTSNSIVEKSIELVERFSTLLDDDDWIYFPMPKRVGIGVSRGAACRLVADELTLDFSGTVLNIASRLMDIARPEGLILDQTFPFNLLSESLQKKFVLDENVILRSVAEEFPRSAYYRSGWTKISPANRRPLDAIEWRETVEKLTFEEFDQLGPVFNVRLDAEPLDPSQILVEVTYPTKAPKKGKPPPIQWEYRLDKDKWSYEKDAGRPKVVLQIDAIAEKIAEDGVKKTWPVTYRIRYPT